MTRAEVTHGTILLQMDAKGFGVIEEASYNNHFNNSIGIEILNFPCVMNG